MQLDLAIHQSLLKKIQLLVVQSEQKSSDKNEIQQREGLGVKERA